MSLLCVTNCCFVLRLCSHLISYFACRRAGGGKCHHVCASCQFGQLTDLYILWLDASLTNQATADDVTVTE